MDTKAEIITEAKPIPAECQERLKKKNFDKVHKNVYNLNKYYFISTV